MSDPDPPHLPDVLRHLFGLGADAMSRDADGWVHIDDIRGVLPGDASSYTEAQIKRAARAARLEVHGTRIRKGRRGRRHRGPYVPDILFHATTTEGVKRARKAKKIAAGEGRMVYMSADLSQAWRAAHRLKGTPVVLAVDTLRARKNGVRFVRNRHQRLYRSSDVPLHHVLTLRKGFAEQWSAGGIPVRRDADGVLRMALIRVRRRSGDTWEVAKGKLEPGETPEMSAAREVQEEMGVDVDLDVVRFVGHVRYGFLAPGGLPRLKTIFLYLMEPTGEMNAFSPSEREGIGAVRWFTPDEACKAVTHSSLQPLMRKARELLAKHGLAPEYPHYARKRVDTER